jgi:hypothetical protein
VRAKYEGTSGELPVSGRDTSSVTAAAAGGRGGGIAVHGTQLHAAGAAAGGGALADGVAHEQGGGGVAPDGTSTAGARPISQRTLSSRDTRFVSSARFA